MDVGCELGALDGHAHPLGHDLRAELAENKRGVGRLAVEAARHRQDVGACRVAVDEDGQPDLDSRLSIKSALDCLLDASRGAEHARRRGESGTTSEDQRQALVEPFLHHERRRLRREAADRDAADGHARWNERRRGLGGRAGRREALSVNSGRNDSSQKEACEGAGKESRECWTGASHAWNIAWKTDGSSLMTPSTPSPSNLVTRAGSLTVQAKTATSSSWQRSTTELVTTR